MHLLFFISLPIRVWSIVMSMYLFTDMSQKPHAYFTKFSLHVNCGCGLVLWWQCNTLYILVLWMTSCCSNCEFKRMHLMVFERCHMTFVFCVGSCQFTDCFRVRSSDVQFIQVVCESCVSSVCWDKDSKVHKEGEMRGLTRTALCLQLAKSQLKKLSISSQLGTYWQLEKTC